MERRRRVKALSTSTMNSIHEGVTNCITTWVGSATMLGSVVWTWLGTNQPQITAVLTIAGFLITTLPILLKRCKNWTNEQQNRNKRKWKL